MPIVNSDPCDLGRLIFDADPYIKAPPPPPVPPARPPHKVALQFMLDETEVDKSGNQWYFKGASSYVAKALRIPYCYMDADGLIIQDYLLVGFEGGGGY